MSPKTLLESHDFFQEFSPENFDLIVENAKVVTLTPGDILFSEGDAARTFYLVQSGLVAVSADWLSDDSETRETFGPGDILGWSWLIPPYNCQFGARAVEPTTAVAMNGSVLLAKAEQDIDFGFQLLKAIARTACRAAQAELSHSQATA